MGRPVLMEQRRDGQRQLQFMQPLSLDAGDGVGVDMNGPLAQDGWPDTLARLLLDESRWLSGTAHAALPDGTPPPATPLLSQGQPARPVAPILALLLALLFLAERWLAERPRQNALDADPRDG